MIVLDFIYSIYEHYITSTDAVVFSIITLKHIILMCDTVINDLLHCMMQVQSCPHPRVS